MKSLIEDARKAGVILLVDGDKLRLRGNPAALERLKPILKPHKPEIIAALKAEQQACQILEATEVFEERAAIAEHDGGLNRNEAEELAVRTVWRWALENGDSGIHHGTALTYEEARRGLERTFQRKITHLEFVSAIAEGVGFVAYRPENGKTIQ